MGGDTGAARVVASAELDHHPTMKADTRSCHRYDLARIDEPFDRVALALKIHDARDRPCRNTATG
jgi:hypothetical protein